MIPYGRQNISQADINEVIKVLKSDFITQGPTVPLFEQSVINSVKAKYACATNSATSALHLACLSLNLTEKDILWTSPISFVASANCGLYCGANIDFVDINPDTYNICIEQLEKKLRLALNINKLPKVVVCVHLGGQSCEMQQIKNLSEKYDFKIIEDASHALGGKYKGYRIGSCEYSDITVFSFHPVKIITTGEGGMAVTNDAELDFKLKLLRSHGISRHPDIMSKNDGPWYYEQLALGYNYRMTDIQAALGISQMARLDKFIKRRTDIAQHYNYHLARLPLRLPQIHPDNISAYHLYIIRLKMDKIGSDKKTIFKELKSSGLGINLHYIPIYRQPYFKQLYNYDFADFPESEKFYSEAISIPIFPEMTNRQLKQVTEVLSKVLCQ